MKYLITILFVLSPLLAMGELSIPNFHSVDQTGDLFRGREPGKYVSELPSINITDVIILKNDVRGEVQKELQELESIGVRGHHIPFRWKEFTSYQVACEQIIDALKIIQEVREQGGKTYFHCTAGEDRTGLLAGLVRMLDEGLDRDTVFHEEMCMRGYGDGNPNKPYTVTNAINRELTPLFIEMARKIESGEISAARLDKRVCRHLKISNEKLSCK